MTFHVSDQVTFMSHFLITYTTVQLRRRPGREGPAPAKGSSRGLAVGGAAPGPAWGRWRPRCFLKLLASFKTLPQILHFRPFTCSLRWWASMLGCLKSLPSTGQRLDGAVGWLKWELVGVKGEAAWLSGAAITLDGDLPSSALYLSLGITYMHSYGFISTKQKTREQVFWNCQWE